MNIYFHKIENRDVTYDFWKFHGINDRDPEMVMINVPCFTFTDIPNPQEGQIIAVVSVTQAAFEAYGPNKTWDYVCKEMEKARKEKFGKFDVN